MKRKKRFFTNHSKSSAMVVSLVLHAILLVVALFFVAVTVVTKNDTKFDSKQVNRPRLPPKKLQVPVKIKKQQRKPKLRQRIVAKQNVNRNMPDIKMPEISGVKGGLGGAGGVGGTGLGDAGGIGFSMPEIEVFGVRSKGEKVFLALDSDVMIMRDEVGGMRAYTIIKNELVKIIDGLSSTTLFNLVVFDHHSSVILFPRMVPATRGNVAQVKEWLDGLNLVSEGMDASAYGVKTLGKGGMPLKANEDLARGKLQNGVYGHHEYWYRPATEAMVQQADTIFILSGWWGVVRHAKEAWPEWSENKRKVWHDELVPKAKAMHAEENEKRAAKGEAPLVIRNDHDRIKHYLRNDFDSNYQPQPEWYFYTGEDFKKALHLLRKDYAPKVPSKSGVAKTKKDKCSLNVIYFAPKDTGIAESDQENFQALVSSFNGKLRVISGLEAIQSSVSGSEN